MPPAKPNRPLRPSLAWVRKQNIRKAEQAEQAKERLVQAEKAEQAKVQVGMKDHALLADALQIDLDRLGQTPAGTARIPKKRNLVAAWLPFVEKYLEAGKVYANAILVQVMIWLFDLGDIAEAMRLADIAIDQRQPMPKRFSRDVKTFVADAVYEWAAAKLGQDPKASIEPYFSDMLNRVREWPVHDQIKIKYLKLAAKLAPAPEEQLALYKEARAVHPELSKCKTAIAKLEKQLRDAAESEDDSSPENETAETEKKSAE